MYARIKFTLDAVKYTLVVLIVGSVESGEGKTKERTVYLAPDFYFWDRDDKELTAISLTLRNPRVLGSQLLVRKEDSSRNWIVVDSVKFLESPIFDLEMEE